MHIGGDAFAWVSAVRQIIHVGGQYLAMDQMHCCQIRRAWHLGTARGARLVFHEKRLTSSLERAEGVGLVGRAQTRRAYAPNSGSRWPLGGKDGNARDIRGFGAVEVLANIPLSGEVLVPPGCSAPTAARWTWRSRRPELELLTDVDFRRYGDPATLT